MEKTIKLQSEKIDKFEEDTKVKIQCLMDKLVAFEQITQRKPVNKLKCTKCDFETQSEVGLKTHITRKHTAVASVGYPKYCELCEKQFVNAGDMKRHMKTHSFKSAKFKCEDCDFVGQSQETMEVHIGKTHTDTFECGLCEQDVGNVENLETHLHTCEIYRCRRCYTKETKISEIKAHVFRKHKGIQDTLIDHLKISRTDESEVTSKEHWSRML